jgi:spermidine synthase
VEERLVQQFDRLKFNVDVVEIDQRVKDVAIEYFYIDPETNIIIDDARRYINTCEKKYDVITLDLFLNETPPGHVLTLESFKKIKELLNPDGMVMMNFYGYISGIKVALHVVFLKHLKQQDSMSKFLPLQAVKPTEI